jgi:hypothetical protein
MEQIAIRVRTSARRAQPRSGGHLHCSRRCPEQSRSPDGGSPPDDAAPPLITGQLCRVWGCSRSCAPGNSIPGPSGTIKAPAILPAHPVLVSGTLSACSGAFARGDSPGLGGRSVRQEQAQGILIASLGMLAVHFGYCEARLGS